MGCFTGGWVTEQVGRLKKMELPRFKNSLIRIPLKDGYERIPRSKLRHGDSMDLCELIIRYYGKHYGKKVIMDVLRDIRLLRAGKEQAWERSHPRVGRSWPPAPPLGLPAPPWGAGKNSHFIDHHREQLIQRVTAVDGILDLLHGPVLDTEQYQSVRAEKTNQEKMRKLYELVPSWNTDCKDQFYQALKDKHRHLVEELEGK
uniref:Apoptosis-associated speck-like protein containing a CARD n=1 Tax=Pelusios castaneus TaxID=367368 RepID=A0A8C8SRQ2_9SAUR